MRTLLSFLFLLTCLSTQVHASSKAKWVVNKSGTVECHDEAKKQIDKYFCLRKAQTFSYSWIREDEYCGIFIEENKEKYLVELTENIDCRNSKELKKFENADNFKDYFSQIIKASCDNIDYCRGALSKTSQGLVTDSLKVLHRALLLNAKEVSPQGLQTSLNTIEALQKITEDCVSSIENPETLASLMMYKDLAPFVKTLEHETSMFHWYNGGWTLHTFDNTALRSLGSVAYANYMKSLFWENDKDAKQHVGKGLYAARDPVTTDHFGNTLLKIDLPKGTNFLDLTKMSSNGNYLKFSTQTRVAAEKVGCDLSKISNYDKEIKKDYLAIEPKCEELFNETIKSMKLGFLTYNYGNRAGYRKHQPNLCNKHVENAFVIIDAELSRDTITVFKRNEANYDPESEKGIEYRRLNALLEINRFSDGRIFVDKNKLFNKSNKTKKEDREHWKKRIYECQK